MKIGKIGNKITLILLCLFVISVWAIADYLSHPSRQIDGIVSNEAERSSLETNFMKKFLEEAEANPHNDQTIFVIEGGELKQSLQDLLRCKIYSIHAFQSGGKIDAIKIYGSHGNTFLWSANKVVPLVSFVRPADQVRVVRTNFITLSNRRD